MSFPVTDDFNWQPDAVAVEPAPEPYSNPPESSPDDDRLRPHGFIEWFVVSQTAIPAMLYLPGSQAFRLPLRVGAYGVTLLGFLLWWFDRGRRGATKHPAERWLLLVLLCLVTMIFHPGTASLMAGVAQTTLYFAVLCPVFWAPSWVDRRRQLVRILAILLVCNGINSIVGVMQVYDPARWMPRELSSVLTREQLDAAKYLGPDGRLILRPPGLFDTPGAVCGPGTIAALLGLIFALEPLAWWKRAVALLLSFAGIAAIYLSHVRTNLVVLLGMMAVYAGILATRQMKTRAANFTALAAGVLIFGLSGATFLGGDSVHDRFSTLFEENPRQLYYANRGQQVEFAFTNLISDYPLGAGLARWGMMRGYFGDTPHFDSPELWAEVQPNGWILDGGIFLLGFYAIALVVTARYEWILVRSLHDRDDKLWAAAVAATNLGTLALLFTFVPFVTQVGLQYWFLEGALHGALGAKKAG